VSWAEVANALQTGVADGYFNPPASALLFGHTAVLDNFTPLEAGPSARMAIISQDWYAGLDDKTRGVVDEAIAKGIAANREWTDQWIEYAMKQLQEQGVTITELEPGQRELFVEASKKVWGDVLDQKELAILTNAAMN
jgi:TRAP-type C4-dicarboxylate transport system substrate-binding protein